jgi:hypothetical protein
MNKTTLGIITSVLVILLFIPCVVNAQEKEKEDTPYWYISQFKMAWAKIDSYQTLVEKYTDPMIAEAKKSGKILDYHTLIHHTGDEYNVVIMAKLPSWCAIDQSWGFSDAWKKIEPDEEKRKAINAAFDWAFEGTDHIDNIYFEATH